MARKRSITLTEAELRLMNVLWQKGSATVHEVVAALPKSQDLAYTTVLTVIRILERKGYVKHFKQGRAHVYMPLVGRNEAARFEVRNLLNRFFRNSHELLVLNILQDQNLDEEELERLRKLLKERAEA